jgi:hypothetical protein
VTTRGCVLHSEDGCSTPQNASHLQISGTVSRDPIHKFNSSLPPYKTVAVVRGRGGEKPRLLARMAACSHGSEHAQVRVRFPSPTSCAHDLHSERAAASTSGSLRNATRRHDRGIFSQSQNVLLCQSRTYLYLLGLFEREGTGLDSFISHSCREMPDRRA